MTPQQLNYFTGMQPGQTLTTSSVKDPIAMVEAAKEYIDAFGSAEFNQDYTILTKLNSIPQDCNIHFYFLINITFVM